MASDEVISALVGVIKNPDAKQAWEYAAWAIGRLGVASDEVTSALVGVLKSPDAKQVRGHAAWALVQLGVASEELISIFVGILKDPDAKQAWAYALSALGDLGVASDEVISAIVGVLEDIESHEMLPNVIWPLREMIANSEELIKVLSQHGYETDLVNICRHSRFAILKGKTVKSRKDLRLDINLCKRPSLIQETIAKTGEESVPDKPEELAEIRQVAGLGKQGPDYTFSEDFHSAIWFGDNYVFGHDEAECLRILFRNWEKGTPEVSDPYVLGKALIPERRFADVFKNNPAWNKMIVEGSKKGTHRLISPYEKKNMPQKQIKKS